jgi:hypothetical protein
MFCEKGLLLLFRDTGPLLVAQRTNFKSAPRDAMH